MFCCGCNHAFKAKDIKRVKLDNGLTAQVCPLVHDGDVCNSEDIFSDRSMARWRAQRNREDKIKMDNASRIDW